MCWILMLTHRTRFCLEKFKIDIVVNRKKFPIQGVFFLAIISQFLGAQLFLDPPMPKKDFPILFTKLEDHKG